MRRITPFFLLLFFVNASFAQNGSWHERPPFASYWQQDVHYTINAVLDDKAGVITADEELIYTNNSPDTVHFVFFHLYQNAFQPGSYMEAMHLHNYVKPYFGPYESMGLGTKIDKIVSGGKELNTEVDGTIMKVYLDKPLLPNQQMTFSIDFKTFFDVGTMRRRMKVFAHDGYKHFDVVHWYPRISVYDRKHGWNTAQHLGREFYGDFGIFDVSVTLPNHYIMDATGTLMNRNEVLPADLREKLDIKNFAKREPGAPISVIVAPDGSTKTWKYHAENVHDFAWTADPTYRIGEVEWNGVKCVALAQEPNAPGWQNAAEYTAKIIETYSTDFGMYGWPKIIVADARDGMEYPMLTLDGGRDPSYRSLLAHEVGHMWFFGMLGSNETYRAFMDEGFTQFLTVWALNRIEGEYEKRGVPKNFWTRTFQDQEPIFEERLYRRYLEQAEDPDAMPINTHSDEFGTSVRHGGGYSQVYYKTGVMLYNLRYVLGDEVFLGAMKHYVNKWKFAHPYPEDFREAITEFVGMDLSWFFDQWIESIKYIDYSVESVKKGSSKDEKVITFRREGSMQMPLDFTVYTKDGKSYSYHIPNTWYEKPTKAKVLPRWIGWNNLNREYEAVVSIPGKIDNVVIDTTMQLADINQLNNELKCPVDLKFDAGVYNRPSRKAYDLKWRPDVWYNAIDGLKAGLHLEGDYYNKRDFFSFTAWYNTGLGYDKDILLAEEARDLFSFNFSYADQLPKIDNNLGWFTNARWLDGLVLGQVGIRKELKGNNTITADYKAIIRPEVADIYYLIYPQFWIANQWNNTANVSFTHAYRGFRSYGNVTLSARASAFSDYSFSTLTAELEHSFAALRRILVQNRLFGSFSAGSNIAPESKLYLAGGNPEEMMENKFVRSRTIIPDAWVNYTYGINHFQYAGGLNLRGFSGYLAPTDSEATVLTMNGVSGAAYNLEIDYSRLFKFKPGKLANVFRLKPYLFFDAGIISTNASNQRPSFDKIRMDAGPGFELTIKQWGIFETAKPLSIRFDMPLYVDPAPFVDGSNFKFRWLVGINSLF